MKLTMFRRTNLVTFAIIASGSIMWLTQSMSGVALVYEPARWWNINGLAAFIPNLIITIIWSLLAGEMEESSYTMYQRVFMQTVHIIGASLLAHLVHSLGFNAGPLWGYGVFLVLAGIGYGFLQFHRQTGNMACAFTSLTTGYVLGPIVFVMALIITFVAMFFTAAAIEEVESGNLPFEQ